MFHNMLVNLVTANLSCPCSLSTDPSQGSLPVKPLLALLSLLALPVMAAEPTIYGRYENITLPEPGRNP